MKLEDFEDVSDVNLQVARKVHRMQDVLGRLRQILCPGARTFEELVAAAEVLRREDPRPSAAGLVVPVGVPGPRPLVSRPPEAPSDGLPRTPEGWISNCALRNAEEELACQMCGGNCPDAERS